MATTTLLRIKSTATDSISHILKDRTEYIENEDKTNFKELVSTFNCTPETAYLDFTASKILYNEYKGTETKKKDDILAYHIRQAFSPEDNLTAEQAHEIGKKLVDEFTKGKHEYVIATHIDKKHIHNHIIFNSTNVDCTNKFNNYYNSTFAVRKISDKLCQENNLSVVTPRAEKGKHYKEWQEDKKGGSWKSKLKRNIDKCIENATSFEEFKKAMHDLGYEIKEGKHIAFRAKGQERFTRAKTLGDDYTQENITVMIEKHNKLNSNKCHYIDFSLLKRLPFTIDKQVLYAARKNKISDVKLLANTLMTIRNENIQSRNDFQLRIDYLKEQSIIIKEDIKKLDSKIKGYREVAKYLVTVHKHKNIYQKYEKCNAFSKNEFYKRHEGDIISYEYAIKKLSEACIGIETDFEVVMSKVKEFVNREEEIKKEFKNIDNRMKAIGIAKDKVDYILCKRSNKNFEYNKMLEEI